MTIQSLVVTVVSVKVNIKFKLYTITLVRRKYGGVSI